MADFKDFTGDPLTGLTLATKTKGIAIEPTYANATGVEAYMLEGSPRVTYLGETHISSPEAFHEGIAHEYDKWLKIKGENDWIRSGDSPEENETLSQRAWERGEIKFNGPQFHAISLSPGSNPQIVLGLTAYGVLEGYKAFLKTEEGSLLTNAELKVINPKIYGTALMVVGTLDGKPVILGQAKGAVEGMGMFHSSLIAGGGTFQDFKDPDPFKASIQRLARSKIGLELNAVPPPSLMLHEYRNGNIALVSLLNIGEISADNPILKAFRDDYINKVNRGAKIEVEGMRAVPTEVDGLVLLPLNLEEIVIQERGFFDASLFDPTGGLQVTSEAALSVGLTSFSVGDDGELIRGEELFTLRPAATGVLSMLSNSREFHRFMDVGFSRVR